MMFAAVAWIALGAAGFFIFNSQQKILRAADRVRSLDRHAREAKDALAELRVSQQAYVAAGQDLSFWTTKVSGTAETAAAAVAALRQTAANAAARTAADEASSALAGFADVDKRARDYVRAEQLLMAGDVIFMEGGQLASVAAKEVETARQAEHQAFDAEEAQLRRQQATAGAAAAALTAIVALILGITGSAARAEESSASEGTIGLSRTAHDGEDGIVSHAKPAPPAAPAAAPSRAVARSSVLLKAAADLATDFGRVRDSDELARLLARTADLLDANGIIVWLGSRAADDVLRPVLTHGYAPQVLARMPAVPRNADNAAAAAYRTGALQIVLSRPGGPSGAIVAPLLAADGCIGALSAEIKDGGEGSEGVQAIGAIVAAHLATVLAVAPAESVPAESAKAASQ